MRPGAGNGCQQPEQCDSLPDGPAGRDRAVVGRRRGEGAVGTDERQRGCQVHDRDDDRTLRQSAGPRRHPVDEGTVRPVPLPGPGAGAGALTPSAARRTVLSPARDTDASRTCWGATPRSRLVCFGVLWGRVWVARPV